MPVHISVSRVRNEIMRMAGRGDAGDDASPSTRLLGRMFHDVFARLLGHEDRFTWKTALLDVPDDESHWHQRLTDHLYESLVGPAVRKEQVHLRNMTAPLIDFWQACRNMCAWIVSLLWESRQAGATMEIIFNPEQEASVSFFEPGWTDSVVMSGIADLVLKISGISRPDDTRQGSGVTSDDRSAWCVVEFKLGISSPEADLAQVCLYHRMMSEQIGASTGAMALIRFSPDRTERVFMPDEIKEAQNRLKNLAARMAGVLPDAPPLNEHFIQETPLSACSPAILEQAERLVSIFREYGKTVSLDGEPIAGPVFIRTFIKLGEKVKLKPVQEIDKEIQHRMQLAAPPIINVSEGRVVVDFQRSDRQDVLFSGIRHQLPAIDPLQGCSRIIIGVDLSNNLRMVDLDEPENAHILIAGTTGSGKSEWIRTAIAGLLLTNTPDTLRLVLIDPKRNAFTELKGSPFLLHPHALVYPDEQPAERMLEELVEEMDRRYRILEMARAHRVEGSTHPKKASLPRIVCVCDEYVDLINRTPQTRKKIEAQIFRLGAKARSADIHLMIATQNPCRQVIGGTLDQNLPARVGLKVAKRIDASLLLGEKGAESLLGKGDLLFKNIGTPVRLQCPILRSEERRIIFSGSGL